MLGNLLAAIVNPSAERAGWERRHPWLLAAVISVAVLAAAWVEAH